MQSTPTFILHSVISFLLQVTAESIFLGESSPSLDDAGRPLVGVIIGILRDACNFSDFSLCDHTVDAKQAASGVTALAAPPLMPSINRDDLIERPSIVSLKEPQTETDRTRVRFKHSLVARLGAIARKLLEVVDIIQRSSSTELTQFTEIWKIQWHFEATMFIENRLEMQHVNTLYSIAACNRSFSIHTLLPPPPPFPSVPSSHSRCPPAYTTSLSATCSVPPLLRHATTCLLRCFNR